MIDRLAAIARAVEGTDREVAGWITDRDVHVAGTFARDAFAFDDAALLALVRAARSDDPPRALFHSHPDGRAAPSAADRHAWAPAGVPLWPWPHLIVATRAGRAVLAARFVWRGDGPIEDAAYTCDGGAWRLVREAA